MKDIKVQYESEFNKLRNEVITLSNLERVRNKRKISFQKWGINYKKQQIE